MIKGLAIILGGLYLFGVMMPFLSPTPALAQGSIFGPDICNPNALGPDEKNKCDFCALLRLIKKIINWLITIAFVLAPGFIVYGGFVIMTAGGSPDKVKSGRGIITAAVIGLAITLGAWLIVGTVIQVVTGSLGTKPTGFPWPWNQISC